MEKKHDLPPMPSTIDGLFGNEDSFLKIVDEVKRQLELNDRELSAHAIIELIGRHRGVPRMTEVERREVEKRVTEVLRKELYVEDEIGEFFADGGDDDPPRRNYHYNRKLLEDDHGLYMQDEQ